jgi:hypothetical protein
VEIGDGAGCPLIVFVSQDFRSWKEKMMDYLDSQRLLGYVLG